MREVLKTKFKLWLMGMLFPIIAGGCVLLIMVVIASSLFYSLDKGRDCSPGDIGTTEPVNPGGWTEKGSTQYKNAQTLWKAIKESPYYKDKVHGDGMVAGMIGNAANEGGFQVVDRAQGSPGNAAKDSSISEGVMPIGGGGGFFQFTPFEDFAPLGDKKWLDVKAQVQFLFEGKMGANRANMVYQQFMSTGNNQSQHPEITADWFLRNVEKPADPEATVKKRINDACVAYTLFGNGTGNSDIDDNISGGSSNHSESESSSGCSIGGSGPEDGTGAVPDVTTKIWTNDTLEKNMKPYALDPEKLGLEFGGPKGWLEHSGQCVDLTESLGAKVWGLETVVIVGNGKDQAAAWATKYGGKVSKKPQAGAIFSTLAGSQDPTAGHTGIVSHVFEDGSTLIVEQNVAGYSGAALGKHDTWNYRLLSSHEAQDTDYTYYAVAGHKPKLTMKG